ncbi:MAG: hypothetical protein AB1420_01560 [Bacillota bacterium]
MAFRNKTNLRFLLVAYMVLMFLMLSFSVSALGEEEPLEEPLEEPSNDPSEEIGVIVKSVYPSGEGLWFDEKSLCPQAIEGVMRYFLKVTFEDADNKLSFNDDGGLGCLKNSRIFPRGSGDLSFIDTDFLAFIEGLEDDLRRQFIDSFIFVKAPEAGEAYLFIPIKLLSSHTVYEVMINPNIVYLAEDDEEESGSMIGNYPILWSFTTMARPIVSRISPASVTEWYDGNRPIYIYGDFFYGPNVDVYFEGTRADWVQLIEPDTGPPYLEVYLPTGSSRLKPGMYSVIVTNSMHHEYLAYSSFSVVPEGLYYPKNEYWLINELSEGRVLGDRIFSENTLYLNARHSNTGYLEFNMDDVMGNDAWVRKIYFEGSRWDAIGQLKTISRRADITVYGLAAEGGSAGGEVVVKLGRVEPQVQQQLLSRLHGYSVKSELIQVTGTNFKADMFLIKIPYTNSNGTDLKVLRYDEEQRRWLGVEIYTVVLSDRSVQVLSSKPGIFVVVE